MFIKSPENSPLVYLVKLDSGDSPPNSAVSTSVTAFLGRAPRGPVHSPTLVSSFSDYQRQFGGLDQDSSISFAVRDFFAGGGSEAVIVRAFVPPDPAAPDGSEDCVARVSLPVTGADGSTATMTLRATSPGTWANGLRIEVDDDGLTDEIAHRGGFQTKADLFNLTITLPQAGGPDKQERLVAVSMLEDAGSQRLDRALAAGSSLVALPGGPWGHAPAAGATGTVASGAKGADSAPLATGLHYEESLASLAQAELINLLCIPPDDREGDTPSEVYASAGRWAEEHRAFLIVDPPARWLASAKAGDLGKLDADWLGLEEAARFAAVYFPRVRMADPLLGGRVQSFPACGLIAGVMASNDALRGVWKAPAGADASLPGIAGLEIELTDEDNGELNSRGINCLRSFPTLGPVIWGARTLRGAEVLADEFKYLSVRRLASYIELSLRRSIQWAAFEPNDEALWAQLRLTVGSFMNELFQQGAFAGSSTDAAYFVQCDSSTNTPPAIEQGLVNIVVGFAPLHPAEFVYLYVQQITASTEAK